jgi:sugar lactone lactonase YvrE
LGTSNYALDLRDIVSGNNDTSGNNGFTAQAGYDRVTGIGVADMNGLVQEPVGASVQVGVKMPAPLISINPGQSTSFSVAVGGGSTTYQWQIEPVGSTTWSALSDSGTYTGTNTPTLGVVSPTASMSGDQFECVLNLNGNVPITTSPGVLIIRSPLVISTLAGAVGQPGTQNGVGNSARFDYPSGIAIDSSGNLYIADYSNNSIREVTPAGVVSTPYGSSAGQAGETNGAGGSARFNTPNAVAIDNAGHLYVADTGNNIIRKIAGGVVTTLAGANNQFNDPAGIAVDASGNVYVADTGNDTIRKITPSGSVSVFAGQTGNAGYADGAGTSQALFNGPAAVAVDTSGNVYVADAGNSIVREITPGGVVSTIAGQPGVGGYLDGPGASALFDSPAGLALDSEDNIYVADGIAPPIGSTGAGNNLVRKITPAGVVSTLAGYAGHAGSDNGAGNGAQFYSLQAVAINDSGMIYLADTYNQTIRSSRPFPQVTVLATKSASVFGSVPGQFTVTRVGSTADAITVDYTTGGTAVKNVDYGSLAGVVIIPAGVNSVIIGVTPRADSGATTNPVLELTLAPSASYALDGPSTASLTIQEPSPFDLWQASEFGANSSNPSIAGILADPTGNGIPNLLEYAFGGNPTQRATLSLPQPSIVQDSNATEYVAVTYTERNDDSSLTYTVQVTGDLTQQTDQWHSGSSYTTLVSQVVNGNFTQVTVRDNSPISGGVNRFIRVVVGNASTTANTVPEGMTPFQLPATTNGQPATSYFSSPLSDDPIFEAPVSAVGAKGIAIVGGPWATNQFASPSSPYFVKILTGAQVGRVMRVVSNTSNTLMLDTADDTSEIVPLNPSGFSIEPGNTFEIFAGDTLGSMFGLNTSQSPLVLQPGTGVLNADSVSLFNPKLGTFQSYYFDSGSGFWKLNGSSANANDPVVYPYAGFEITRNAGESAASFYVVGRVPDASTLLRLPAAGQMTYLSTGYPANITLAQMQLGGSWTRSTSAATADTISIWNVSAGAFDTYYELPDSTWREAGNPTTDQSNFVIQSGTMMVIDRAPVSGSGSYIRVVRPYLLN